MQVFLSIRCIVPRDGNNWDDVFCQLSNVTEHSIPSTHIKNESRLRYWKKYLSVKYETMLKLKKSEWISVEIFNLTKIILEDQMSKWV